MGAINFSCWPQEEIFVMTLKTSGGIKNFEAIVLCSPKGYFMDRSDLPRMEGKEFGKDVLARIIGGKPTQYPEYAKYLTSAGLVDQLKYLMADLATIRRERAMDQLLVEEKLNEIIVSVLNNDNLNGEIQSDEFELGSLKIALKRRGATVEKFNISYPNGHIEGSSKFIYSESDSAYENFDESKYLVDISSLNQLRSFGFHFVERDNGVYIDYDEKWSKFLYSAPQASRFSKNSISHIDGKPIADKPLNNWNEGLKQQNSLTVRFSNGEEFTYKSLPFEAYNNCLNQLSDYVKSEIFWTDLKAQ